MSGNFVSATLGQFVKHFEDAWHHERKRPDAAVLNVQYDWDNYYKEYLFQGGLAGFTNSKHNPESAHGFRIARAEGGTVELRWKNHAADPDWLGVTGEP